MGGFIGFTGNCANRETVLNNSIDKIAHRGPDLKATYFDEQISLGQRRLRTSSLENKIKVTSNESGTLHLVFDGEIYNASVLRQQLTDLGHVFKTDCSGEVLIHCYEEYNGDMLNNLRGMFSFVIWDSVTKTIFGARDFFGIKPLCYSQIGDVFIFGSEIKSFFPHPSFTKELNANAVKPFLSFQHPATQETFFKNVFQLPPAHYFHWKDNQLTIQRYHDVKFDPKHQEESFYVDQIDKVVRESVDAHKSENLEVGAFLSSGVDSSYITACLMPKKTFTVGFAHREYSEVDCAQALSKMLDIENHSRVIQPEECFRAFSDIQYYADEPAANPSAIPLYFLAELAAEHVEVVLGGEGADELFGGYPFYALPNSVKKYKKLCPAFIRSILFRIANLMPEFKGKNFLIKGGTEVEKHFTGQSNNLFRDKEALSILKEKYHYGPTVREITKPIYDKVSNQDDIAKMQYLDINLWLSKDILLKADKMLMAHSLELRVPLLDKDVMELAQQIPSEQKIKNSETKIPLRKAAANALPEEWAKRKKIGFYVPVIHWLREEKYYKVVKETFNKDFANEFFDVIKINKMLDQHFNKKKNHTRKIWVIFTFLTWYERVFLLENE